MSAYDTKPGGWRTALIIGLFVLVFLLVLGLAWQARQAAAAQRFDWATSARSTIDTLYS